MEYDFDKIIDRRNTNSLKYDFAKERGKPEGLLPMWVADMDFQTPPEVTDALIKSAEHGIFGYSDVKEDYFNAVRAWFISGFDFELQPEWLTKTPGVVFALATAVRAFTKEGDSVLIQRPVYYPFSSVIVDNNRKLVNNPLVYENGAYSIDFADFEKKIKENKIKLFLLCSPHNPVGRVWTKAELIKMGDICQKYGCLIVSDEIHCDFIYSGYKHHIFSGLKDEFLNNSIICTAPSKTFNLAGLQASNVFIANEQIRKKFKAEIAKTGYSQLNIMGLLACQNAYKHGKEWLEQLKKYLSGNLDYLRTFINEKIPSIKLIEPQGTYLIWLDFKSMKLAQKKLDDLIINGAKLWLDGGTMFGAEGDGFERINIACPRKTLEIALERLEKLFK